MKPRAIALPALPPNGPAAKLQLALDSLLSNDLDAYRRAYAEAHGQEVSLEALVPAILKLFLQRDRGFQKWKKAQAASLEPNRSANNDPFGAAGANVTAPVLSPSTPGEQDTAVSRRSEHDG